MGICRERPYINLLHFEDKLHNLCFVFNNFITLSFSFQIICIHEPCAKI